MKIVITHSAPRRPRSLLAVAAIAVASYPVRSADKRIVLIAGRPSHPPGMHEFRAGCLLLQKALSSVPGITVQVYDGGWPSKEVDGARVDDSAALDNADAVLIFSDGGRGNPAIQGERAKVLDALAAKGVGLGFAHYAVEVPAGVPGETMQRWIGGYYETNFSVNPMWKPAFDKFPTHPDHARRRALCHARRVVLQHAVDGRRGGEGQDHAHPRLDAERRGTQGSLRQPARPVRPHHRRERPGRNDDVGVSSVLAAAAASDSPAATRTPTGATPTSARSC